MKTKETLQFSFYDIIAHTHFMLVGKLVCVEKKRVMQLRCSDAQDTMTTVFLDDRELREDDCEPRWHVHAKYPPRRNGRAWPFSAVCPSGPDLGNDIMFEQVRIISKRHEQLKSTSMAVIFTKSNKSFGTNILAYSQLSNL